MVTIIRKSVEADKRPEAPVYRIDVPVQPKEEIVLNPIIVADKPKPSPTPIADRASLLQHCQHEYNKTLLSRKALSNTINDLLHRNASQAELRELYEKIKAYQPVLENLFKRTRHVEQYGVLPEGPSPGQPMSIEQMKMKRAALVHERAKTKKKLSTPGNAKPEKILQWEEKLARANAEYDYIDEQIKKFEGKA